MSGIFYGVGVGPGDPELLTLKAIKIIEESSVLAIPVSDKDFTEPSFDKTGKEEAFEGFLERCVAYQIVKQAGVCVEDKAKLYLPMPMMKEKETLKQIHDEGAALAGKLLEEGEQVAFITLGDPTVYSTCMYIHKRIQRAGFETSIIPGVPSFCAVAARLNMSLVENKEELHVIPASYEIEEALKFSGTKVLMKTGKKIPYVKEKVREHDLEIRMIENCGMESERIYSSVEEIPDETSYYSLFIVKERK